MLKIQNKEKLVGEDFQIGDTDWKVDNVIDKGSGTYWIILWCKQTDVVNTYILTKEENFVEWNANYKITDRDYPMSSVWVNKANVSTITSMLRTLKRIVSYANNP